MNDVKRCPTCGKALEVSHMVLGKLRTHPCACLCEIRRFEAAIRKTTRRARASEPSGEHGEASAAAKPATRGIAGGRPK